MCFKTDLKNNNGNLLFKRSHFVGIHTKVDLNYNITTKENFRHNVYGVILFESYRFRKLVIAQFSQCKQRGGEQRGHTLLSLPASSLLCLGIQEILRFIDLCCYVGRSTCGPHTHTHTRCPWLRHVIQALNCNVQRLQEPTVNLECLTYLYLGDSGSLVFYVPL